MCTDARSAAIHGMRAMGHDPGMNSHASVDMPVQML